MLLFSRLTGSIPSWTSKKTFVQVEVPVLEEDDISKYLAPALPSAPPCVGRHQEYYDDFEEEQDRKREQRKEQQKKQQKEESDHGGSPKSAEIPLKEESDHGGSSTSTAIPPQKASQQQERPQHQQPQQQPPPGQLLYRDAHNGKSFRGPGDSIMAFIRVKKSRASERRRRKLVEEILGVGARGQQQSLKMWVDVPEKTSSLSQCKQAKLHLDGNALGELGDYTRYDVWMYVNVAKPKEDWGNVLGEGWHPYGINQFGGDQARPVCNVKDINMEQLLQGKGPSIYLGVRLIPSANPER